MRSLLAALGFFLLRNGSPAGELPDLGTRKQGSDWPSFLGPTADSVSTETGIMTKWPKDGLRVVWSKRLGGGYAMPSISRGRQFVFDRVRYDQRLQCLKSETGEGLLAFKYPTDYEDKHHYRRGPRTYPLVER